MGKLDGKIGLITGGNSGIGFAAAKRFVAEGAYVFVTGRRKAELEAAVKEIGENAEGVAATCRNSPISIGSSHASKTKKVASMSYSQMPASQNMPLWVR